MMKFVVQTVLQPMYTLWDTRHTLPTPQDTGVQYEHVLLGYLMSQ